jgi:hypothetical protein
MLSSASAVTVTMSATWAPGAGAVIVTSGATVSDEPAEPSGRPMSANTSATVSARL